MKYLIITGGSMDETFLVEVVKNGGFDVLVAADSGMDALFRNEIMPELIVGDMDSVNPEAWDFFSRQEQIEIIQLTAQKDDTDTEFAIREAIRRGADEITILGGTGTRLDHVMGNISLLGIGLEHHVKIQLLDPCNRIRLFDHEVTLLWKEQYGTYVSLLPFGGPVTGLTLQGMKYSLTDARLDVFRSLGISNEIVEDEAKITWTDGYLLVIESRES